MKDKETRKMMGFWAMHELVRTCSVVVKQNYAKKTNIEYILVLFEVLRFSEEDDA